MPQLDLALSVFECRGLFREHYLTERLPAEQPEWEAEVASARNAIAGLMARIAPTAERLNEATLEGDLVRPILDALGFNHHAWLEKQDAGALEPDYTVFRSQEEKIEALGRWGGGRLPARAESRLRATQPGAPPNIRPQRPHGARRAEAVRCTRVGTWNDY